MRIVFMGTPEFAVPGLEALLKNNFNVVAVVTVPDKPAGRGQQVQESAVKKFALSRNIPVLQPEKLKDPQFIEQLRSYKADLQFVVAFRMLPEIVWNMPAMGTYNLHASLLPRYRGAAPINRAIMNGDTFTGVTTFRLQHEIDTGNILFNKRVEIGDETTAGELHDLLMDEGKALILETAKAVQDSFEKGRPLHFIPQDDTAATHAPKIFREDCRIKWSGSAKNIHNQVRGLSPHPAAFTMLSIGGAPAKTLKIYRTTKTGKGASLPAGSVAIEDKKHILVHCADEVLLIEELQLEGKKRVTAQEFLRGVQNAQSFSLQ